MVETAAWTAPSRARDTAYESLMMDLEWWASKRVIQVSVMGSEGQVRMVPGRQCSIGVPKRWHTQS